MVREKVTITMDREKAAAARKLSGAASTSEAVDIALDALISREQLRRDVAAYKRMPPTADEIWLAEHGAREGLDDDVDWELLYADVE